MFKDGEICGFNAKECECSEFKDGNEEDIKGQKVY
jgi:hypothetical protein